MDADSKGMGYDVKKVMDELIKKWESRPCPMCGKGPWVVQGRIFQLLPFVRHGVVLGGPVIPLIPITCENCGNTILVNAVKAGVPQPPKKESEEK